MKKVIKKITLTELADVINTIRSGIIGEEISFAEYWDETIELNPDNVESWHTITKFSGTEVLVRYMGGIGYGLVADSNVSVEDVMDYYNRASSFSSNCTKETIVYLETEISDKMADDYNDLSQIIYHNGLTEYTTINFEDDMLSVIYTLDNENGKTEMSTLFVLTSIACEFYGEDNSKADNVKVIMNNDNITMLFPLRG